MTSTIYSLLFSALLCGTALTKTQFALALDSPTFTGKQAKAKIQCLTFGPSIESEDQLVKYSGSFDVDADRLFNNDFSAFSITSSMDSSDQNSQTGLPHFKKPKSLDFLFQSLNLKFKNLIAVAEAEDDQAYQVKSISLDSGKKEIHVIFEKFEDKTSSASKKLKSLKASNEDSPPAVELVSSCLLSIDSLALIGENTEKYFATSDVNEESTLNEKLLSEANGECIDPKAKKFRAAQNKLPLPLAQSVTIIPHLKAGLAVEQDANDLSFDSDIAVFYKVEEFVLEHRVVKVKDLSHELSHFKSVCEERYITVAYHETTNHGKPAMVVNVDVDCERKITVKVFQPMANSDTKLLIKI